MSKKVKKIIALLAVVAVLGITAIGCGESKKQDNGNNQGAKTEEKQQANNNENKEFKIGDSISLDNMILTVTDIEESEGDSNNTPKDGCRYVTVYVNLENKGKDNIKYDPLNFKIKCQDGELLGESLTTLDGSKALEAGELSSGASVTGSITYEVPKAEKLLQLNFQDKNFANDAKITIDLNKIQ